MRAFSRVCPTDNPHDTACSVQRSMPRCHGRASPHPWDHAIFAAARMLMAARPNAAFRELETRLALARERGRLPQLLQPGAAAR